MRASVSQAFHRHAASQWAAMRQPRSPLARLSAIALGVVVLALAAIVVVVVAVIAVPVGLIHFGVAWVRSKVSGLLPTRRSDGRRNVRVRINDAHVGSPTA